MSLSLGSLVCSLYKEVDVERHGACGLPFSPIHGLNPWPTQVPASALPPPLAAAAMHPASSRPSALPQQLPCTQRVMSQAALRAAQGLAGGCAGVGLWAGVGQPRGRTCSAVSGMQLGNAAGECSWGMQLSRDPS